MKTIFGGWEGGVGEDKDEDISFLSFEGWWKRWGFLVWGFCVGWRDERNGMGGGVLVRCMWLE